MNDDEPDTRSSYQTMRDSYWEMQRAFREKAVDTIVAMMPVGVDAVVLQVNDSPRLALHRYVDSDGVQWYPDDWDEEHGTPGVGDAIDMIANDMEAYDWDEADSFLMSAGDGESFVIERPEERS